MKKNKYVLGVLLTLAAVFGFFLALIYQTRTFLTELAPEKRIPC